MKAVRAKYEAEFKGKIVPLMEISKQIDVAYPTLVDRYKKGHRGYELFRVSQRGKRPHTPIVVAVTPRNLFNQGKL